MQVELIRIGNSRGIRIPKPLIEQCGLGDKVDLRVERNCLVIAANRRPREGWEKNVFKAGRSNTTEQLLPDTMAPNDFDRDEWQW